MSETYNSLAHAVQSGVKAKASYTDEETTPVSLRVGVNMAMVDSAALASLLIEKGIISEEEYLSSLEEAARQEVSRYERELSAHHNSNITLA